MLTLTDKSSAARVAWVDAGFGIAGDMFMAALLDAGADLDFVRGNVVAVIGDAVRIDRSAVSRRGQRATMVDVRLVDRDQPRRAWSDIRSLIEAAEIPDAVRAHSLAVFERLARAEARTQGINPEEVTFHEVGAWDCIADIVGGCAALEDLGVGRLYCSHVALGEGVMHSHRCHHAEEEGTVHVGDHSIAAVPGSVALELLAGGQVSARALPVGIHSARGGTIGGERPVGELATMTGVALLTTLADGAAWGPDALPRVASVGVGAGHDDFPRWPNVVRVVLGPGAG